MLRATTRSGLLACVVGTSSYIVQIIAHCIRRGEISPSNNWGDLDAKDPHSSVRSAARRPLELVADLVILPSLMYWVLSRATGRGMKLPVIRTGTCGTTIEDQSDCLRHQQGSWSTALHGIDNLADCALRCLNCTNCRHVSYSAEFGDVSCSQLGLRGTCTDTSLVTTSCIRPC